MNPDIIQTGQFREQACQFAVSGDVLKGILALPPDGVTLKGAIVFSHGWSGFRSGPSAILTFLARAFAQQGYASLRFDYRGRGESGGNGLQTSLLTMADDLVAAVAFLKDRTGVAAPALCGLCSGGNVVIGTLKRLPAISRLLLLSVYPFSDGDAFSRDVHRTVHYLKVYALKLLRPDTWKRFLKGDVKLKNVFNVIFGHFLKRHANSRREGGQPDAQTAGCGDKAKEPSGARNTPPKAVKAAAVESRSQGKEPPRKHLANLRPDLPGIMVYGTADPDADAAIAYYGAYIKEHSLPIPITTIQGANHNFSSSEWREHLLGLLTDALKS